MKNVVNNLKVKWKILYKFMICIGIIFVSSKITFFTLTSINTTDFYTEDNMMVEEPKTKIMKEKSEEILLEQEVPLVKFTREKIKVETNENEKSKEEELETEEAIISYAQYASANEESTSFTEKEELVYMISQTIPEYRMELDDETYEVLLRVVEAEVTGSTYTYNGQKVSEEEMLLSKIRVAQVFMNRVDDSSKFSNITNLYDSLTQKGASSTFADGRYYTVTVCDLTREAVELALLKDTPDYTDGALFFNSCTKEIPYGDYLFTDNVGHHFFK